LPRLGAKAPHIQIRFSLHLPVSCFSVQVSTNATIELDQTSSAWANGTPSAPFSIGGISQHELARPQLRLVLAMSAGCNPVLGPRREFYPVPYDRRWKGSTANSISHATGTRITWVLRCCTVVCFPGTVKAGGLGYLAGCTAIFVCQLTPDDMQTEMRRRPIRC